MTSEPSPSGQAAASAYEARLTVTADGDTFKAQWIEGTGAPSEEFSLSLPLSQKELDDLDWYLGTHVRSSDADGIQRADEVAKQLVWWGRMLFSAIFDAEESASVYLNLKEWSNHSPPPILTISTNDRAVLKQPWELLRDEQGPLTFSNIVCRRQVSCSRNTQWLSPPTPLRILLIISRPRDMDFIDPRKSVGPLFEAFNDLPPDLVHIDFCEPPTLERFNKMIEEARNESQTFHIVHFDGHGVYLPQNGVSLLAFEDTQEYPHFVPGQHFSDLLARLQVPLVVLEASRSANLSNHMPDKPVAHALLQSGVGSVIAFSHPIHVEPAGMLVQRFYRNLAVGRTIGHALNEARVPLYTPNVSRRNNDRVTSDRNALPAEALAWFVPHLYQVGTDLNLLAGRVVSTAESAPPVAPNTNRLHAFPPLPRYKFQGRAQDLHRLERDFLQHRAVLLTGMGGMGKTALAREAASWWLNTRRFDEAVFVSLEQCPPAERVVQLIGQALKGLQFSQLNADDQWKTVVQEFQTGRVLLVWDNAESVLPQFQQGLETEIERYKTDDLARLRRLYLDLIENHPCGRLLITCRPTNLEWPHLKVRPLLRLARTDSHGILQAVLDRHAQCSLPQFDQDDLDKLLELLGDHPLSLELVGPHLLARTPGEVLDDFRQLLDEFTSSEPKEERNRSLRASLAFSIRHLSSGAQALLPWLAYFSGGVFEDCVQRLAEMEVTEWEPMLAELVNTALVRVESVEYRLPRYLYLHPTLPYAAQSEDVPDPEDAKRRFLEVYRAVGGEAYGALFGANPSAGMALMRDEEANYRVAIAHAFQGGERQLGWALTDTLREYLERDARQRERDRLVCWVREQLLADNIWDEAACASIRDYAWTLFSQGQVPEAVKALEDLLTRLKKEELSDGSDSMAQEALTLLSVGRIRHSNGQSELALDSLEQAVDVFKQLGEPQRVSLAAALGELANAHHNLGNYEKALSANEHSLAISRELNQAREIAANLGRGAGILMDLQRYSEAEWHYSEALRTAQQANERELQETLLQNRGLLQYRLGNRGRAIELYQDAITRSQQAYNLIGEMQTSTLLGNAERELGNLDAADGWYQRARELAVRLGDDSQLGEVEHNLGILSLTRAEQVSDVVQRTQLLQQAVDLVQEALRIRCELPAQVPIAESYFQLGVLYLMRNDLAQAEMYLLNSKDLRENLGLPVISETYANLAQVAYERGNVVEAARWQILYEAAEAELIWRRGLNKNNPPVVQFDTLLRDIAAVARGEDMNQSVLEKNLSQLEEKKWRIADASRRIWAGERDLTRLAQGVDLLSLTLIARILQFVDHPDTPLLWPDEPDEPGAHPGTPGPPVPPVTDPWTIAEPEPPVKPSGTDPAEGRAATLVPRFVVLLASVTGLTMSILWFMDDRSWEPGIGIVTAISAFLGALIDFKEKRVVSLWKSSFAWLAVVSGFTIAMLFSFAINTHVLLPGNTQPPAPPDTPTLAPSHFRFEVYVKDSATGRPIPNAEVTVGEVGQLAPLSRLTDVNGYTHFEIPSEHAGERATVTLQVDDSYKSRTVDLTRDSAPINISFP